MLINVLSSKCWNFMFWFATHHTQLFDYFAKKMISMENIRCITLYVVTVLVYSEAKEVKCVYH